MYEYYNTSGEFVSQHTKQEVAEKKAAKSGGFVIDPDDYRVEIIDQKVFIHSIPGTYCFLDSKYESLSNSAYHRCGVGTSWRCYWIERKEKAARAGESMDAAEAKTETIFHKIKIKSIRADKRFEGYAKVPPGVDCIYLSAGKGDVFSSRHTEDKGSSDLITLKFEGEGLADTGLVVPELTIEWSPEGQCVFA
jgi:hypothetical protein